MNKPAFDIEATDLETTFNCLTDGVFSCDSSWRLRFVNEAAANLLGIERTEALGQELWEVLPDIAGTSREMEFRIAASGEIREFYHHQEIQDRFLEYRCFPWGRGGVSIFIRDITERRTVEELFLNSQDILGFALRMNRMGAWDFNLEDKILTGSHECDLIFGYDETVPYFTYETFLAHVIPEHREMIETSFREVLAGRSDIDLECCIRRKDGEVRWIRAAGMIQKRRGKKTCMSGFVQDITKSKIIIEELENKTQSLTEVNTALKILLRNISEEKKEMEELFAANTKKIIIPYLDKIKKERLTPECRSYISIIEENLTKLISPFLHTLQQYNFTPREMQIASLIKDGKTTKEIAATIGVAPSAVNVYRNRIRSKLQLNGRKINLQQHLDSIK